MRRYPSVFASLVTVALVVVVLVGSHALAARRFGRGVRIAAPPQNQPAAVDPQVAPAPLRIDPTQAMADLLSVRRALAGDSLVDEAEFAAALRDVIEEKQGAPLVVPASATAPLAATDHVAALRASAAHFDRRAAELEAEHQYESADAARDTAAALRQEARRLDP